MILDMVICMVLDIMEPWAMLKRLVITRYKLMYDAEDKYDCNIWINRLMYIGAIYL